MTGMRQKRVRSEMGEPDKLDELLDSGWHILMVFQFAYEGDTVCLEYILEKEFSEAGRILDKPVIKEESE